MPGRFRQLATVPGARRIVRSRVAILMKEPGWDMTEEPQRAGAMASPGGQSRRAITHEARALFGREGYASVSIDRILQGLNLTKGSFYHHFPDKKALFKAVVAEVQQDVARQAERAGAGQAADRALLDICRSIFRELQKADAMRIICRDAGSVLTASECSAIDEQHVGSVLGEALRRAQTEGVLSDRFDADALIRTITGAIYQTLEWGWGDETGQRIANGEFILLEMLRSLMRH